MNKIKLARKMRTNKEIKERVPIFETKAWDLRKASIATRVANKIKKAQERKKKRIIKI